VSHGGRLKERRFEGAVQHWEESGHRPWLSATHLAARMASRQHRLGYLQLVQIAAVLLHALCCWCAAAHAGLPDVAAALPACHLFEMENDYRLT